MKPNPRTAEYLQAAMKALYGPPMTDDERKQHERLTAREMARAEEIRGPEANYRDNLEFALAYGFKGTPKYRDEAIRSLYRAIEILLRSE